MLIMFLGLNPILHIMYSLLSTSCLMNTVSFFWYRVAVYFCWFFYTILFPRNTLENFNICQVFKKNCCFLNTKKIEKNSITLLKFFVFAVFELAVDFCSIRVIIVNFNDIDSVINYIAHTTDKQNMMISDMKQQ